MNYRDSSGLNPYVDVSPCCGPWGTIDFFQWYCGGGYGRPVDLGDIGLLDDFKKEIDPNIEFFKEELRNKLMTSCDKPRDRIAGVDKIGYSAGNGDVFNPMTVMGKGSVRVAYECEEVMICQPCCPHTPPKPIEKHGKCRVRIEVLDRFSQPTDGHGGWWENSAGEWWGCEPYDITGNWTIFFNWNEVLGKCP